MPDVSRLSPVPAAVVTAIYRLFSRGCAPRASRPSPRPSSHGIVEPIAAAPLLAPLARPRGRRHSPPKATPGDAGLRGRLRAGLLLGLLREPGIDCLSQHGARIGP